MSRPEKKLSTRFKDWMDGDDAFAGRWDWNKVLRALRKLERLERLEKWSAPQPIERFEDGAREGMEK